MIVLFWLCLCGIAYAYAGYPLIIWILSRLRPRPWKAKPITPTVSVVLAVHNGGKLLRGKIDHLLSLKYPNIAEIIIVSDGSTDDTAAILKGEPHPGIKPVVLTEHAGKAVAINAGLSQASGDIILFVDIRPEIAPGAIEILVSNFADDQVGCVAGELRLRQDGHDAGASAISGIYWRYEQWLRTQEAIIDSPVGVYGGFYAIRRNLAVELPAGTILDDMFQPLSIVRQGYRSVVDPRACVYDTWPKKVEGEFNRKVRTLAGNFQLFRLAPWVLTRKNRLLFQLVSHKLLRLVVPYLLICLFVCSICLATKNRAFAVFTGIQVCLYLLSIVGFSGMKGTIGRLAGAANALVVLNAAAVVALYKYLFTRGPLWKIWNATGAPDVTAGTTVASSTQF